MKIYNKLFFFCVLGFLGTLLFSCRAQALVVNHLAVPEFENIPAEYITQAKQNLLLSYGHTSHGSQLVTGMGMLSSEDPFFQYTSSSTGFLCDSCISGASDLGNPDFTAWVNATRSHLNGSGSSRNVIMWSWCGQVSGSTSENIQNYLSNMSQLESEFPGVHFVYMTGHLDGSGEAGNLKIRNQQIRDYVIANNKLLFDFADIESWDPAGNYYPDESDACGWCSSWCASHSCPSCGSCAHSHCFNCYQKGKAFWYLMARIAGWNGQSGSDTTAPSSPSGLSVS